MKKSRIVLSFFLINLILMVVLVNVDLYPGTKECYCVNDDTIIAECAMFCTKNGSMCTYFEVITSDCDGGVCFSNWEYGCETGKTASRQNGKICSQCEDDPDLNLDNGDEDPPRNSSFTPLDASGHPMW